MKTFIPITIFMFSSLLITPSSGEPREVLTIAAASDAVRPLQEIAGIFEENHPVKIEIISGSTGKLYTQITQGAPFHIFFAADDKRTALLKKEGLAEPGASFKVTGTLVVWTNREELALGDKDLSFLKDAGIKHIAVANPDTAPYGYVAFEALRNSGLMDSVKDKLVYGESVSHAFNFTRTGNADVAIVSLSIVYGQGGDYFIVDSPPIIQEAVILKNSPGAAKTFLEFLRGGEAASIFSKYGYKIPVPKNQRSSLAWMSGASLADGAAL